MNNKQELLKLEQIREERRLNNEKIENLEFEKAPLLYLRQKIKKQEERIEELEKIIINLIPIIEKSTGEKKIFSRVLQE